MKTPQISRLFPSTLAGFAALAMSAVCAEKEASAPAEKAGKSAEAKEKNPDPKKKMEVATLAGGCFWCLDATYIRVKGVEKVESGYTGGKTDKPTYKDICTGLTGHAEAVQITFDPEVISYEKLLGLFFELHDPTTLNRQGYDEGTQYRSAIFYHNDAQKAAAEKVMKQLADSGNYKSKIVTELSPLGKWHPAEDYHQNYFDDNYPKGSGNYGYLCRVVLPKVEKLKKLGIELKQKEKEKEAGK